MLKPLDEWTWLDILWRGLAFALAAVLLGVIVGLLARGLVLDLLFPGW